MLLRIAPRIFSKPRRSLGVFIFLHQLIIPDIGLAVSGFEVAAACLKGFTQFVGFGRPARERRSMSRL